MRARVRRARPADDGEPSLSRYAARTHLEFGNFIQYMFIRMYLIVLILNDKYILYSALHDKAKIFTKKCNICVFSAADTKTLKTLKH